MKTLIVILFFAMAGSVQMCSAPPKNDMESLKKEVDCKLEAIELKKDSTLMIIHQKKELKAKRIKERGRDSTKRKILHPGTW